jgi:uncharacterized DUF497 family protein
MDFDWHRAKSEACRRDRGFDFAYAARIFAGPVLEQVDDRRDYGEVRMRALGEIDGSLYVVVFTDRFDADDAPVRWIISARRAHQKERQRWLSDR